jgi:uncharacterized protein YkwD
MKIGKLLFGFTFIMLIASACGTQPAATVDMESVFSISAKNVLQSATFTSTISPTLAVTPAIPVTGFFTDTPGPKEGPAQFIPSSTPIVGDMAVGGCNGENIEMENVVFNLINEQRSKAGITQFTYSSAIASVARDHSKLMAQDGFFEHGDVMGRLTAAGSFSAVGENIYAGPGIYNTANQAVGHWLNSSNHRMRLFNTAYTLVGIGYWCDPNSKHEGYFTADFARP